MGIVFPSEAVARRWHGALQARLRRAPLEFFLTARAITTAPPGAAQNSDDLARATVSIVQAGLALYLGDRAEELSKVQREIVGHVACVVNRVLADLIAQPEAWRIASLVSTAQLLAPWIGLNGAALEAAPAVRRFEQDSPKAVSSMDARISHSALTAVTEYSAAAMTELAASIATRLNHPMEARFAAPRKLSTPVSG